jgi:hypothetical protein
MVYYTIKIEGGLCNQLFQIFSVMGMATRDNVDFVLCNKIINNSEIKRHSGKDTFFDNFLQKLQPYFIENIDNYQQINENDKEVDHFPFVKNYYKNILFNGYFQDYHFLELLSREKIRSFLSFPDKYLDLENTFFIHYRRGDYIGNAFHEVVNDNYYSTAIMEYPQDARIVVCSNEKNYGMDKPFLANRKVTFIETDEITTLLILTKCQYGGICANSSFSWWGGYLNESPDKIICLPYKWFNSTEIKVDKYYYPGTKKINF